MLPVDVNEIINDFKTKEFGIITHKERLKLFEKYCMKPNQSVIDGIKIGYMYGWTLVMFELMEIK